MHQYRLPRAPAMGCLVLLASAAISHHGYHCTATGAEVAAVAHEDVSLPSPPSEPASEAIEYSDLPTVMDAIQAVLDEKGYREGYDTETDWEVWTGTGEMVDLTPEARTLAFIEAQLEAKAKFATSVAGRTASASQRIFSKGAAERQQEIRSLEARAQQGNAEARRLLAVIEAAGEPEAPDDARWRKRIENATTTLASAELCGLIVYQAFECAAAGDDPGQVGVIMVSTPKTRQMAEAMLAKAEAPVGTKKEAITKYVKDMTPDELVSTIGAKTRWNERGDLCVVAFGQAPVEGATREDDKFALKEAEGLARQALRSVAGELALGEQSQASMKDKTQMANGTPIVISAKSLDERIASFADFLGLPGASTVHATTINSPRYGKLRVVVLEWNTRSAQAAKDLGNAMQRTAGSRGGDGVQGSRSDASASRPASAGKPAVSGAGRRSDDDDQ
jgi:hypothetical protein